MRRTRQNLLFKDVWCWNKTGQKSKVFMVLTTKEERMYYIQLVKAELRTKEKKLDQMKTKTSPIRRTTTENKKGSEKNRR